MGDAALLPLLYRPPKRHWNESAPDTATGDEAGPPIDVEPSA